MTAPYTGPYRRSAIYGGAGAATKRFSRQLYSEMPERYARKNELQGQYDNALANPEATAGRFTDFFQKAAEGFTAPAMRDFNKSIGNVSANVASRFGGNGSSEELRQVYNAGDAFSRNLTESLSRLAPEQAKLGLEYTGQLGQAAGAAGDQQDRLAELIMAALKGSNTGINWGQMLGTAAGVAAAAL